MRAFLVAKATKWLQENGKPYLFDKRKVTAISEMLAIAAYREQLSSATSADVHVIKELDDHAAAVARLPFIKAILES
jgi:hypothetical protein